MWIELSNDVQAIDLNTDHVALAAIETVLTSAFRGEHVIVGARATMEGLRAADLSRPSRAALALIVERLPELLSIAEKQLYKVTLSAHALTVSQPKPGQWTVPLRHFAVVALVPSGVIAENLRDAKVLAKCAQQFQMELGPRGLRVVLVQEGAGGPEVAPALQQKILEKRQFSVSVTDTDRKHPDGAVCSPSHKCAALAAKSEWVADHIPLHCREMENALPNKLLTDAVEASDAAVDYGAELAYLQQHVFSNLGVASWADLKLGTPLGICRTVNQDAKERLFWHAAAQTVGKPYKVEKGCLGEVCEKGMKDCQCLLLPGIGEKTLDRFLSHCESISLHKQLERVRTSVNKDLWFELGRRLGSWGLAFEKVRS